ncbi:MAG TPA: efflux RND transporter periplasmic adaptor subunit [Fibrobacteraceae bacterium]|nr:efflux RND transporter periplasmic adaptor subunit [Fibrobacteraceae bacterium]
MNLVRLTIFSTLSLLILNGCKGKPESEKKAVVAAPADEAISVVLDTLKSSAFEEWVSYPAELRGSQDAVLTAGGGGRVLVIAEVGRRVNQGDALCDIEAERYGTTLAQAQAALDFYQGELERADANVKAGSVGKAALDQAKLQFEGAKVSVLQAKRAYEDSRCQAPFSGVIVSRNVEQFETVTAGSPTLRIARTDKLEALISLPESDLSSYKSGSLVRFSVPGVTQEEFAGRLKTVDMAVDSKTRTALARLEIVNQKSLLGPGMAGKALMLRKKYDKAIIIPTTSILRDETGPYAMIAVDGRAQTKRLTLGPSAGDSTVVLDGLQVGDVLVAQGGFRLTDGVKVKF